MEKKHQKLRPQSKENIAIRISHLIKFCKIIHLFRLNYITTKILQKIGMNHLTNNKIFLSYRKELMKISLIVRDPTYKSIIKRASQTKITKNIMSY